MKTKKSLHRSIVEEILPRIAQRLKEETVISSYDHVPIKISIKEPLSIKSINVVPDLMIHLPDERRILIEVANPRDPKRFLGEILYPQILGYYRKIDKVIVFVLRKNQKSQQVHDRGFQQKWIVSEVFGRKTHTIMMTWSNESDACHNLRLTIKGFLKEKQCSEPSSI
jgi:hypothetical protein